jgi:adenosylhomocysteine nucleosidase
MTSTENNRGEGRPTAVVAAMSEELAPLLRRIRVDRRRRLGSCEAVWGRLGRARVVIVHTGEGPGLASRGAATILDNIPVDRLLVTGLSGGLSTSLELGDLLIGRRVFRGGKPAPAPDPDWTTAALRRPEAEEATFVCTPAILSTRTSKAALRRTFDAPGPAAVDLETAAFAEAAAQRGVPYLAVRAVCDTLDEELPLDFERFRDDSGRILRGQVARHALLHPRVVGPLREMRRRVSLCAERLARFNDRLLNEVM